MTNIADATTSFDAVNLNYLNTNFYEKSTIDDWKLIQLADVNHTPWDATYDGKFLQYTHPNWDPVSLSFDLKNLVDTNHNDWLNVLNDNKFLQFKYTTQTFDLTPLSFDLRGLNDVLHNFITPPLID